MGSKENNIVDEEACQDAFLFATSVVFPMVLNTAIELDLFNIIAKAGPGAYVSASEIASQLPTKNPKAPSLLDRMLHLFATHSLLSYSLRTLEGGQVEKMYALTPASKFFTGKAEDGNISSKLRISLHKASIDSFLNMKNVILEGETPFKKVHGMTTYEYMNKDDHKEFKTFFDQTMVGRSTVIMNGILAKYKGFEGVNSLVDVGGGTGRVLNLIISKYPSIKGVNFDLPYVIQSAPPNYSGIEHIGGDMFTSVPRGDAIMIMSICHNWNDENAIKVLKNIYEALPNNNGKLIIIEALLAEKPETTMASQYVSRLDNIMFTQLPSGKERSATEFEALTKAAGFTNFQVACVAHGIWAVMESYKKLEFNNI